MFTSSIKHFTTLFDSLKHSHNFFSSQASNGFATGLRSLVGKSYQTC